MGTTLTALKAGSVNYCYVVAIEGYSYLLTNAPTTAAAVTAWAGTDWTQALGGLFVEIDSEQSINPWEPFQSTGGSCTVRVVQDAADTFGIAVNRRATGPDTELQTSMDRVSSSVTVGSTDGFASSGEIHIGTECIVYSSKASKDFLGLTRGKYSPFLTWDPGRFTHHHRVSEDSNSVTVKPRVTQYPRTWKGRWCGVWMHRVVGGVLDTKAEAQLVFAGRLTEPTDDPSSFSTCFQIRPLQEFLGESSIGRDMWRATIKTGIYLHEGERFKLGDQSDNNPTAEAPDLIVISSAGTPANDYEIREGRYSLYDLFSALNSWFAAALDDSEVYGAYLVHIAANNGTKRVKISWRIPGSSTGKWSLRMPQKVWVMFGWRDTQHDDFLDSLWGNGALGSADVEHLFVAPNDPYAGLIAYRPESSEMRAEVQDERGTFVDNYAYLPSSVPVPNPPASPGSFEWGIFEIGGFQLVLAAKDGNALRYITDTSFAFVGSKRDSIRTAPAGIPYSEDAPAYTEVRQILVFEAPLVELLGIFFFSTGNTGFNSDELDVLPYGYGLDIPFELLDSPFTDSLYSLRGAEDVAVLVFDEPSTLADLFAGDLILRNAFLVWKEGTLRFGSWQSPTSGVATQSLTESEKSSPQGQTEDHRAPTIQSEEWLRPAIKIDYNRDITAIDRDGGYRDHVTLEDQTAIDDSGGEAKLFTIKARNSYGNIANTGLSMVKSVFLCECLTREFGFGVHAAAA